MLSSSRLGWRPERVNARVSIRSMVTRTNAAVAQFTLGRSSESARSVGCSRSGDTGTGLTVVDRAIGWRREPDRVKQDLGDPEEWLCRCCVTQARTRQGERSDSSVSLSKMSEAQAATRMRWLDSERASNDRRCTQWLRDGKNRAQCWAARCCWLSSMSTAAARGAGEVPASLTWA